MKNLLKLLSPFAPDQSGAVSVIYELGGLIVICDAGGCAGNVCGFDEPRWFTKKSAIFSAGLRDMDAILGRDDKLIAKLKTASSQVKCDFTALIGTPVPAVIATDFRALKNMAQKSIGLPCLTVEANGTAYYDEGEESAYLELFKDFAVETRETDDSLAGVIGVTPLEFSRIDANTEIESTIKQYGFSKVVCYGMGSTLEDVKNSSAAKINYVVSPSAITAAEYLNKKFGTPYEIISPYIPDSVTDENEYKDCKKILVIHQQISANGVRNIIEKISSAQVDVASWFMMKKELMRSGDFKLTDEEQLIKRVSKAGYDCVIADNNITRALRGYKCKKVDYIHFAVSGRMEK